MEEINVNQVSVKYMQHFIHMSVKFLLCPEKTEEKDLIWVEWARKVFKEGYSKNGCWSQNLTAGTGRAEQEAVVAGAKQSKWLEKSNVPGEGRSWEAEAR